MYDVVLRGGTIIDGTRMPRYRGDVEERLKGVVNELERMPEAILFTIETGGGRGCGYFLGHDTTTMKNAAWRTLLQRAAEWAATGKVTIAPAKDWPATKEDAERMAK